ncbi:non-structural maintenance of chromosomes element 1 homolog isoform X4 [Lepidochelys kempii]|uniref:non-structural maintenance of chromosomes element 1 homolog isoform X3 n=1 Tax=Caretta caretta TaxID=8467 RepID=UPI0020958C07|nr:non-structural maintenance of chromosomes element 1 homolog isoform X5 [Caretta caretta]
MATQMTDGHRRFLQVLMSHGIMEGSVARTLHRDCCEIHKVYYAHDKLDDFINVVNIHLQPFFMQIRKGMSEDDGKTYYALMDAIIVSENGFASSTNILNLADQLKIKKMKKKEAEQVLQNLVQDKWLSERDGEYTLHTRCIMEMEQYILSNYQDLVRKCNICHSLAIQSQVCETCGIGMHLPCAGKYFKAQMEPHCPHCNEFWPHEIPEINRPDSQLPSSAPRERRGTSSSGTRRR